MKKSIKITANSKRDWSEIREKLGNFKLIKSAYERAKADGEFDDEDCDDLPWKDFTIDTDRVTFKDVKIPLSKIEKLHLSDLEFKEVYLDLDTPADSVRLNLDVLGSVTLKCLSESLDVKDLKMTIELKPKLGLALGTLLKGAFMILPERTIQETVQGWIDSESDGDALDTFISELESAQ